MAILDQVLRFIGLHSSPRSIVLDHRLLVEIFQTHAGPVIVSMPCMDVRSSSMKPFSKSRTRRPQPHDAAWQKKLSYAPPIKQVHSLIMARACSSLLGSQLTVTQGFGFTRFDSIPCPSAHGVVKPIENRQVLCRFPISWGFRGSSVLLPW